VKICVTGGSGFIGSWFCREFARRGDEVVILDLVKPDADLPHDRYVHGDIRDPVAVRAAMEGCEAVLNLAAAHHDFGITESTFFDVNEKGSRVLCDVMDELGIRRACFYSTVAVYGNAPPPLSETTSPEPVSDYGRSKLAGEKVFEAWTLRGDGRSCLVIRPTVTFGPHNFANMYSLIRQIESGKFFQAGPATNIKSLSYIENIMEATLWLWQRKDGNAFQVYNWVEKPDMSSAEISRTVADCLGRKKLRRFPLALALLMAKPFDLVIALTGRNLPISSARVRKLFVDQTKFESDKARKAGFEPSISLTDGIKRMVDWYQAGGRNESAQWHQPPAEVVRSESD
jgi:nucleoside-diphosphate-sugar epimerase